VKVSIIIPTYKDSIRLIKCLNALVTQIYESTKFEVIVVDNDPEGSLNLDNYFFLNLNLYTLHEPIPGSYAARNKGLKFAKNELIGFTDSDCVPDPYWIANAVKYFEKDQNEKLGIIAGKVPLFFKDKDLLTYGEIYEKYTGFDFESYVREGASGAGNWFSYKSILEEFGGFNSELKSNGDTELSKRISKKYEIKYAPDVIVTHPARDTISDIVYKYRRLIGGAYQRRFINQNSRFLWFIIQFSWRRIRFSIKKFFTLPFNESWAIFIVSVAINIGALKEFFNLILGSETKR